MARSPSDLLFLKPLERTACIRYHPSSTSQSQRFSAGSMLTPQCFPYRLRRKPLPHILHHQIRDLHRREMPSSIMLPPEVHICHGSDPIIWRHHDFLWKAAEPDWRIEILRESLPRPKFLLLREAKLVIAETRRCALHPVHHDKCQNLIIRHRVIRDVHPFVEFLDEPSE